MGNAVSIYDTTVIKQDDTIVSIGTVVDHSDAPVVVVLIINGVEFKLSTVLASYVGDELRAKSNGR